MDPEKSMRPFWHDSHSIVREVVTHEARDPVRPAIEFDLSRPLKPQLSAAKRLLENRQRAHGAGEKRRRRPGLEYQRHLRLLDALEDLRLSDTDKPDAKSIRAIGTVLFPGDVNPKPDFPSDAKVRAMIPVARRLRDSGYAVLPTLPEQFDKTYIHEK